MNKTIGIFGGGQLGRMMAQAALPLNIQCSFFEAETDCPAAILGPVFSSKNPQALQAFIASADVFSLEFENTPVADVDVLTQTKTLHPPRLALATAQNRLAEKSLFDELGIPVAPYRAVDSLESLKQAVAELGLPIVLKTVTGGYDGKGQFVLRSEDQIDTAWAELGPAKSLIAESFVKFSREVSIIAVRGQDGDVKTWALGQARVWRPGELRKGWSQRGARRRTRTGTQIWRAIRGD
jgi:5-(carboxyamino)imidazole ribonucleotide synthase